MGQASRDQGGSARGEPLFGNADCAGAEDDDATDDGASGVAVAEGADGVPEGFLVAAGPGGGAPEGEGDGVCRGGAAAVAEVHGSFGGGACGVERGGVQDAIANWSGWGGGGDAGEEIRRRGWRTIAGVPAEGGGEGDCDGSGDGIVVAVGGDGGEASLLDEEIEVVGEEGAEGRDAHGGSVAEGAAAVEESLSFALPVMRADDTQVGEVAVHGGAVAAVGIVELAEAAGESFGEDLARGRGGC